MKNIIFIAPPSTGKGTLSAMLKEKYGYNHISTGDLLRREVASGSELGIKIKEIMESGNLVSDEIVTELLTKELAKSDKFILDGYPRNTNQANTLNGIFNSLNITEYVAIYLIIDKKLALQRVLGRIVCEKCNIIYNRYNEPLIPKVEDTCDKCGEKLIQRSDDNEETFTKRFDTYVESTMPVIDFYKNLGKLKEVEVCLDRDETFALIDKVINEDK